MLWNTSCLLEMTKSRVDNLYNIKINSISILMKFVFGEEILLPPSSTNGDGRIKIEGQPCVAYIKNDTSGNQRWHFYKCSSIKSHGSFDKRYVVKTDSSGKFILEGGKTLALLPCQKCLSLSKESEGYSLSFWASLGETVEESNSKFIPMVSNSVLFNNNSSCWTKESKLLEHEIGGYVRDWPSISYMFRKSNEWKCESCMIDLSSHRNLLHAHHVDRNKNNNDYSNLRSLCVSCHSDQPFHDRMKSSPKFESKILKCKSMLGELKHD